MVASDYVVRVIPGTRLFVPEKELYRAWLHPDQESPIAPVSELLAYLSERTICGIIYKHFIVYYFHTCTSLRYRFIYVFLVVF